MNRTATISGYSKEAEPFEASVCADVSSLSDRELLTLIIAGSLPGTDASTRAADWLSNAGGLSEIISFAQRQESEVGESESYSLDQEWLQLIRVYNELFTRQLKVGIKRGTALTSPTDTLSYLQRCLQGRRREVFHCLFLDTRHRVICHEELFQGSIDGACVYPRVVAEHALRHNAAAIIVAHNHPSGVTEPSLADQAITRRLKDALGLLEIRLLDHFVVGDGEPVSMASRGML